MQSLMDISASALGAFGVGMNVTADNIANINTPHYKAGRAFYETGPGGFGVRAGELSRDTSPGPLLPALTDTYAPNPAGYAAMEGSNVRLEREMVSLIATEHAYTANAKVIQTYDQVMGTVLDLKV